MLYRGLKYLITLKNRNNYVAVSSTSGPHFRVNYEEKDCEHCGGAQGCFHIIEDYWKSLPYKIEACSVSQTMSYINENLPAPGITINLEYNGNFHRLYLKNEYGARNALDRGYYIPILKADKDTPLPKDF